MLFSHPWIMPMLALLLAALTQVSAPPAHDHGHPAPVLRPAPESDGVRHLGPLKPGEKKSFEWEVKNTGLKPALFRLVEAPPAVSTEGLALAKPWAPGESRKLGFQLDTAGLRGFQTLHLKLRSDDSTQPEQTLALDLVVVLFSVTPDKVTSLGSIGPKETRTATWELKNLSDSPLSFRLLDLAPGVRVSEGPLATPFAPGETRALTMTIDPTGWVGYQRRAAKLESSDAAQPRYILRIDMTVRPEMNVDSLTKSLREVKPFESPEAVFTFTREGGDLAQIKLLTELPPYLEAELVHRGPKAELHLTLRPKLLKPGVQAGLELLRVETNAPREPRFSLALDWRLFLPFVPEPTRVIFENRDTPSQLLTVKAANGKPFKLLKTELEGPGFAAGTFPKTTVLTSGMTSPIDPAPAAAFSIPIWILAQDESHAVLKLYCEGMDEPLQVPLAYLPPSAPPPIKN